MNAEGGRAVAGTAGFAEVVADGAGRGEKDDGKIAVGTASRAALWATSRSATAVSSVVGGGHRDAGEFTTLAESAKVIGQAEGSTGEGAAKVRNSGAPDEAGVVQGEVRFGLGRKRPLR